MILNHYTVLLNEREFEAPQIKINSHFSPGIIDIILSLDLKSFTYEHGLLIIKKKQKEGRNRLVLLHCKSFQLMNHYIMLLYHQSLYIASNPSFCTLNKENIVGYY